MSWITDDMTPEGPRTADRTHLCSLEQLYYSDPLSCDLFSFLSCLSSSPSPWQRQQKQRCEYFGEKKQPKVLFSWLLVLTWSRCLCLLLFLLLLCLSTSGTLRGDEGRSEAGWGWSAGPSGSSWAPGVCFNLLAASVSCWQAAEKESKSIPWSRQFFCPSSPVACVTSFGAACSDGLNLDLPFGLLLDKWDILGFLLARGSVYSSGRECFGWCAGEEWGVSRRGLTWASGTDRRFCGGWNSLLQRNHNVTHSDVSAHSILNTGNQTRSGAPQELSDVQV